MQKFTKTLPIICFLLFASGCKKNDNCKDIECLSPPVSFVFELLDKESNENLITNGTYQSSDIEMINEATNQKTPFVLISENNLNLIVINNIGWKDESIDLDIKGKGITLFKFHTDAKRINKDCCSFTEYQNLKISGPSFTYDSAKGIYNILL